MLRRRHHQNDNKPPTGWTQESGFVTFRPLFFSLIGSCLLLSSPSASLATFPWDCSQQNGKWTCNVRKTVATEATHIPAARITPVRSSAPDGHSLLHWRKPATPSANVKTPPLSARAAAVVADNPFNYDAPDEAIQLVMAPMDQALQLSDASPAMAPQDSSTVSGGVQDTAAQERCLARPLQAPRLSRPSRKDTPIDISAGSARLLDNQVTELTGDVRLQRGDQSLETATLRYDKAQGMVDAEGGVVYREAGFRVQGSAAHLELGNETGQLDDASFSLEDWGARGGADTVYLEGPDKKRLSKASYTTCPADQVDWKLSAREVTLNEANGEGVARDVKLEFKNVPFLYTPYLSFPIDGRRKSGLLAPRFGSSDNSGFQFSQPYYWNIAPNRDATITPRLLSERGLQLQGEFRYLNARNQGQVGVEYLPSDNDFGDDRSLLSLRHDGRPLQRLRTQLLFNEVSDEDYFTDLGQSLSISSITHLERRAGATWYADHWRLAGLVQDYQTVDNTIAAADRPYRKLPQLSFNTRPGSRYGMLGYRLDAEYVNFDRDSSVTGSRVDIQPGLSLPLEGDAWFVTPSLSMRHTRYQLDNNTAGTDASPNRTLGIFSVDSGLFFEREFSRNGRHWLHTLEPRAYYLRVPRRDQDDIPLFDTGEFDFSVRRLFSENRFSGADRVGDADQLTLAVTNRLLDASSGEQYLSVTLGQILFFQDREVRLSSTDPVERDELSEMVAEVDARLGGGWEASAGLQWNPENDTTRLGTARVSYRPAQGQIINLAYRFRRDVLEQLDLSGMWPINRQWHAVGRMNYSLLGDETLEAFAGFQYDSCCWTVQLVGRSHVNEVQGGRTDAIYLQLELKGLGSLGDPVEDLLEHGILGYQDKR